MSIVYIHIHIHMILILYKGYMSALILLQVRRYLLCFVRRFWAD